MWPQELTSDVDAVNRKVVNSMGCICHDEAGALLSTMRSLSNCVWPQELAAELKAEVREVLQQHGVDNFVLKPVRRSYAFELAEIPRGEQWVLKVRYPASKPSLPLGLSGAPCHRSPGMASIVSSTQTDLWGPEQAFQRKRLHSAWGLVPSTAQGPVQCQGFIIRSLRKLASRVSGQACNSSAPSNYTQVSILRQSWARNRAHWSLSSSSDG